MKIIALGDTHGRTVWKQIVKENGFDKIVFHGDYFDTHERISARQQKENFKGIIAFKKANMDKVILLMGNHDYHYTDAVDEPYGVISRKRKMPFKSYCCLPFMKNYYRCALYGRNFFSLMQALLTPGAEINMCKRILLNIVSIPCLNYNQKLLILL